MRTDINVFAGRPEISSLPISGGLEVAYKAELQAAEDPDVKLKKSGQGSKKLPLLFGVQNDLM